MTGIKGHSSLPANIFWGMRDEQTPKEVCGEARVTQNYFLILYTLSQGECGGYFSVKQASLYAMIVCYDHAPVLSISLMISAQSMANPKMLLFCSLEVVFKCSTSWSLLVINPLLLQDKTESPRDNIKGDIKQNSSIYIFTCKCGAELLQASPHHVGQTFCLLYFNDNSISTIITKVLS